MAEISETAGMKLKLSDSISRALRERNLTLRETSEATGISISTLSEWGSGRIPRNPAQLAKLAEFLDLSLYCLLFGCEDPRTAQSDPPLSMKVRRKHWRYEVTIKRVPEREG